MIKSVKKLKELKVHLYRHRTATNLVLSFHGEKYKDLVDKKGFMSRKSGIIDKRLSIKETIKRIRKKGLWGYCSYKPGSSEREIHYWVDKSKVELCDIGELLCHEMAHIVGIKSEIYAMKYGYVASTVIQLLMKDFVLR